MLTTILIIICINQQPMVVQTTKPTTELVAIIEEGQGRLEKEDKETDSRKNSAPEHKGRPTGGYAPEVWHPPRSFLVRSSLFHKSSPNLAIIPLSRQCASVSMVSLPRELFSYHKLVNQNL